jgi:nucleotide-binding universal stress UspA family protein
MKKIVLPTDFSDNSWNAIFTAVKLYKDVSCHFYLLHAYEPNSLNLLGKKGQQRLGVIYDSLSQYSTQELEKVKAYLNEHHSNTKHIFETISISETLEEAIENITRKQDIDVILMGTQGVTGAKEVFMGSSTVKVIKKVKSTPIIAVPSDFNFQQLKTVVFPTDFTRFFEKYELLPLTELAKLWKSKIDILHVSVEYILNETQESNKNILEERINGVPFSYHNVPFMGNISKSVQNYLTENTADLMALIRYHHSFWEKIIGEPVIKKIAFHSTVPVLMLPEK